MKRKGLFNQPNRSYEFIFIFGILFLFACWSILLIIQGPKSMQKSLFFADCEDFFADATNVIGYSSLRDPYNNLMVTGLEEKGYPPIVYVAAYAFSRLVYMQPYYEANLFKTMYTDRLFLISHILLFSFFLIVGFEIIRRAKSGKSIIKTGMGLASIFSGPIIFTLERGNCLVCIPFLCMAFLAFYASENKFLKELGLLCLALAASIKLVPAVFGLLLIRDKRWSEAARAVLYGLLFFFVPFLFLKGGLSNFSLFLRNIQLRMEAYSGIDGFTIRNILQGAFGMFHLGTPSDTLISIVSYGTGILLLIYAFLSPRKWERVLMLSLMIILVPSDAAYYNFVYLIPVVVLFLNEGNHPAGDFGFLAGFMLLFNPVQIIVSGHKMLYELGILVLYFFTLVRIVSCLTKKIGRKRTLS